MNDRNYELIVQKTSPNPDAKVYEITTIKEMFEVLNGKNHERFLADFNEFVRVYVRLAKKPTEVVDTSKFVWVDD